VKVKGKKENKENKGNTERESKKDRKNAEKGLLLLCSKKRRERQGKERKYDRQ
jgi:hypothetical protein